MTEPDRIRAVLQAAGVPVYMDEYTGTEDRYIVYTLSTMPLIFGDDAPAIGKISATVHYYCPVEEDPTPVTAQLQRALFAAGYTWPALPVGSMVEGTQRHSVLECESEEMIGL